MATHTLILCPGSNIASPVPTPSPLPSPPTHWIVLGCHSKRWLPGPCRPHQGLKERVLNRRKTGTASRRGRAGIIDVIGNKLLPWNNLDNEN